MEEPRKIAAMQILNLLFLYGFFVSPQLARLVASRMVKLTIEHGISAVSSVGFSYFAMVLCGGGRDIADGFRCGTLALDMYNAFKTKAWMCRVFATVYGQVWAWKKPVKTALKPLKIAFQVGLGTGDIEIAMLNAAIYCWNGRDSFTLPFLDSEISNIASRMELHGQVMVLSLIKPLWQMCHNFMRKAKSDPKVLTGEIMDQDEVETLAKKSNPALLSWTHFHGMVLAFFFCDYDLAERYSSVCIDIINSSYGAMDAAIALFYECMTLLAQARKSKRGRVAVVRRRLKRLRVWAKHSPFNFLGKQYLIEAELAVVNGHHLSALPKYMSSILHSREERFLMQEALANERTGKYYLELGDEESALPFLRNAYTLYGEWGGTEKMQHLKNEIKLPLFVDSEKD